MDVHKDKVVVCVLTTEGEMSVLKEYGTFRNDLIRMRVWLKQLNVTEIAMESTGVYWRPVWNVLEGHGMRLLLANPAQVKALHGRKSDKRDSRRIAEFMHDRRLDGSFVPPVQIRQLRELTRMRVHWLEQRNEVHNQIRDLLETVNIKLSTVASDLMGVTGRGILKAIVEGVESPERLSWKARGSLRKKDEELREAVRGDFSEFFRQMLAMHLKHYDFLTMQVTELECRIRERMAPYEERLKLLKTIPGVDEIVAWSMIAEMGDDMSVFPTSAHLSSWAGLCPGENESAGVAKSTRTKKGNRMLRRSLTQSAWAASHTKQGYLRAFFHRVKSRKGWGKAIVALAHKILVIAYEMLKGGKKYSDLGDDYFDRRDPGRTAERLRTRIERLGFSVSMIPAAETPAMPLPSTDDPAAAPIKRKRGRPRKCSVIELINPEASTT